jgi:hypothetical protein
MRPYESTLKITDELERRVAQQQMDDLPPSVAIIIVAQLLVAALLIVASTLLPAHDVAAKEHTLGNHPAVIVFKKWNQAEYANRTAIYPHPATIWWYMQDPNAPDHPLPGAHP